MIGESSEIEIKTHIQKHTKKINLENKFKYSNPKHDITIIPMKVEEYKIQYLELDDNLMTGNNLSYVGNSIYIIHYPRYSKGEVAVSYGIIKKRFEDKKYNFMHYCSTEYGSSGSPILSLENNKIIGIHKQRGEKEYNIGAFLYDSIKEFINKFMKKDIVKKVYMNKLGLNKKDEKDFFINLYNKGLVKDFIHIKNKDGDIGYKFPISQKTSFDDESSFSAWHGTNYKYLGSIIKYGLQVQGTKLDDGTVIPKTKFTHEIKNWENAIFASPHIFLASEFSNFSNIFLCLLEVKIRKGHLTSYSIKKLTPYIACLTPEQEFFDNDEIYRIDSPKNIAINSIIFINKKFLNKILKLSHYNCAREAYGQYIEFEELILKS